MIYTKCILWLARITQSPPDYNSFATLTYLLVGVRLLGSLAFRFSLFAKHTRLQVLVGACSLRTLAENSCL